MYGGMDSKDRERVKAAFQTDPKQSPVRILLATDAASEGIDLQNHCSRMIHFEIPWNPNRLEQRNGRIDRHGQKAKTVRISHFVGKGYNDREQQLVDTAVGDLEADLEFLMRAVRKVEAIREDLGKVGPVIADQVEEAMLGRRTRLDTQAGRGRSRAGAEAVQVRAGPGQADQGPEGQAPRDQARTAARPRERPEGRRGRPRTGRSAAARGGEGARPLARPEAEASCPVFRLPALTGSWEQCAEGLAHPSRARPGRSSSTTRCPRAGRTSSWST